MHTHRKVPHARLATELGGKTDAQTLYLETLVVLEEVSHACWGCDQGALTLASNSSTERWLPSTKHIELASDVYAR